MDINSLFTMATNRDWLNYIQKKIERAYILNVIAYRRNIS